jgi:hypothetical protein
LSQSREDKAGEAEQEADEKGCMELHVGFGRRWRAEC